MEFLTTLTDKEISSIGLIVGGLGLLLLVLKILRSRRATNYQPSPIISKSSLKTAPVTPEATFTKDGYDDEISTATLILGSSKEKVEFKDLVSSVWDSEVSDIVLELESKEILICLGEHDLFVAKGTPTRCDFSTSYSVRIWARGELVYEVRLADISYEDRNVYGYDQYGSDVDIFLGPGLTMIAELN